MSYYTAKYLRDLLADLPDDEPVAGFLMLRSENWLEFNDSEGNETSREATPEEWVKIVDKWEVDIDEPCNFMRESLNEAMCDVVPEPELYWFDEKGNLLLLISDEIDTLKSALEILDELASSQELDPDYADEVAHVNVVYAKLVDLLDRIEQEVLAT